MSLALHMPGVGCDVCGGELLGWDWPGTVGLALVCAEVTCRRTWWWATDQLGDQIGQLDPEQHDQVFTEVCGNNECAELIPGFVFRRPHPCYCGTVVAPESAYAFSPGAPYILRCDHESHGKHGRFVRSFSALRLIAIWNGRLDARIRL